MELMDPQLAARVLAGVGVGVGLVQALFGYRIFRFVLALSGFFVGMIVGALLARHFVSNPLMAVVGGAVGGLVGAAVVATMYYLGVFLTGAFLGLLLVAGWYVALGERAPALVLLVGGGVGGVLALTLQRFTIIVATSFAGAWSITLGGAHLLGVIDLRQARELLVAADLKVRVLLGAWLLVGVIGMVFQYKVFPRRPEGRGDRRPHRDDDGGREEDDEFEEVEEPPEARAADGMDREEVPDEDDEEWTTEPEEEPDPAPAPRPPPPRPGPQRPRKLDLDRLIDQAEDEGRL